MGGHERLTMLLGGSNTGVSLAMAPVAKKRKSSFSPSAQPARL
jgi:hypothetical protein